MRQALQGSELSAEQGRRVSDDVRRERTRLRSFIRGRVANDDDAEDILQDVFCELVDAYRLMQPIERVGAWLFRVARNRITDLFRRKRPLSGDSPAGDCDDGLSLQALLPAKDSGPEAEFARRLLLEELDAAIDELPPEQREAFVAHEVEGLSFKEIAEQTGVGINTLLSRKRYAILHLRERLQSVYDELD